MEERKRKRTLLAERNKELKRKAKNIKNKEKGKELWGSLK